MNKIDQFWELHRYNINSNVTATVLVNILKSVY